MLKWLCKPNERPLKSQLEPKLTRLNATLSCEPSRRRPEINDMRSERPLKNSDGRSSILELICGRHGRYIHPVG
jgi:hypothetical protein